MTASGIVVVIPAKNVEGVIETQLRALNAQTMLDFDVIVSDNGSTDRTRAVVEAWPAAFASLTCIDSGDRPGVAYARNRGIESSDAPLILVCDSDDVVGPGWVKAHATALVSADAATGPLLLTERGERGFGEWGADGVPVAAGYLPYTPGCNMSFRRRAFETLNGFDAGLWRGQEDVDFGWRLAKHGFSISHAPDAVVEYEQRVGLLAKVRQQFKYGRAFADLCSRYRADPIPVQGIKWRARWWLSFLRRGLRHPVKSWRVTYPALAFQAGRMLGSVQNRVRTPMW
ncbi:glycosyltransferase [Pseudoclavibacter terrae]|uniref:glycosyltransferase n=1 Tax=Pseudoclavibacter terrae TaxID=1530195 RepID=UPI00232C732E|nr:glycosyltransferase family A protein [Pseudoclavibacter terrae]